MNTVINNKGGSSEQFLTSFCPSVLVIIWVFSAIPLLPCSLTDKMLNVFNTQVVVLSEGRVVEAGHPHTLLQLPTKHNNCNSQAQGTEERSSTFSSMVDETGPASAEHLRRLAKEAWEALSTRDKTGRSMASSWNIHFFFLYYGRGGSLSTLCRVQRG